MRERDKKVTILYHANCCDGMAAAWVAWSVFKDTARYFPVQYGSPLADVPPDAIRNKRVYVLDFSFSKAQLEDPEVLGKAQYVTILDHHRSAVENWGLDPERRSGVTTGRYTFQYDPYASGAMMTWGHFPDHACQPPPLLVSYTQDYDLWHHSLPATREVNAYIASIPKTLLDYALAHIELQDEEGLKRAKDVGKALLQQRHGLVRDIAKGAGRGKWGDQEVLFCNTPTLQNEVAEYLLSLEGNSGCVVVLWALKGASLVKFSFRSRGVISTLPLSEPLGGGGHRNASGASTVHVAEALEFLGSLGWSGGIPR